MTEDQGVRYRRTLAIDFDGTIVEHNFPKVGTLKEGVKEALDSLKEKYQIVISSCRASALFNRGLPNPYIDDMKRFLDENKIYYDRIDMGDEGKVVAVAYIDDRAIPFLDNWKTIAETLVLK